MQADGKKVDPNFYWEQIQIKPAIDLIADEFERNSNGKVLVELVCEPEDDDAQKLKKSLEELGYEVSETDSDKNNMQDNVDPNWMNEVLKKIELKGDYEGAIMIFAKVKYNAAVMKQIWSQFTSKGCMTLKNKPKIFIFQTIAIRPRSVEADTFRLNWMAAYETPSEADILIIQDKYDKDGEDFLARLAYNVTNYGEKEDVFTLASIEHHSPPLLISTMTRKFYFQLHERRGNHLDIYNSHQEMKEHLEKMQQLLCETEGKTKKNIKNSIKKIFSFKKHEDRPKQQLAKNRKFNDEKDGEAKTKYPSAQLPLAERDGSSREVPEEKKTTPQDDNMTTTNTLVVNPEVKKRSLSVASNNSEKRTSKASVTSIPKPPWRP